MDLFVPAKPENSIKLSYKKSIVTSDKRCVAIAFDKLRPRRAGPSPGVAREEGIEPCIR